MTKDPEQAANGNHNGRPKRRYWRFLVQVFVSCGRDDIPLLAAALAHFAMLSFIPLMLLAAWLFGTILRSPDSLDRATRFAMEFFPVKSDVITGSLGGVVSQAGTVGIVGLLALIVISMRIFTTLQRALDKIWGIEHHEKRAFYLQYLIALTTVLCLGLLAWLSFMLTSAVTTMRLWGGLWAQRIVDQGSRIPELVASASRLASISLSVVFMFLIYRLLPSARVRSRSALVGAAVAGCLWELAKHLFTWYVTRFVNFDHVYGTLGGVAILMLWTYISSVVLMFGAEVVACHAAWIARTPVLEGEQSELEPYLE